MEFSEDKERSVGEGIESRGFEFRGLRDLE